MPLYEVYVEETHYFREIIRADNEELAQAKFWDWQRDNLIHAYDVDVNYEHTLPVEG